MDTTRREIIGAGLGLGLLGAGSALAQQGNGGGRGQQIPSRKGKITKLFKSPEGYPNGMAPAPNGWWLGEQKTEHAILVDWDGKLLKTVKTESKNTSGIAIGEGFIWMCANAAPEGIFQTDMDSKTVSHRQIPLGGGGCHGGVYADGKLWLAALRLRGILRVDPKTWEPEFLIPYAVPRAHGIAWDKGTIWMVTGSADGKSGLIRFDAATGRPMETVEFDELYPDPHGLAMKDGVLYTCDAGLHPGWQDDISTAHGYVCRIDLV
jgi:sugar lactone lactonase YvrE